MQDDYCQYFNIKDINKNISFRAISNLQKNVKEIDRFTIQITT